MKILAWAIALIISGFVLVGFLLSFNKAYCSDITANNIVDLVNKERTTPLVIDPILTKAAQNRADDMAKKQYFSHLSPEGHRAWYFIHAENYLYRMAGENLAIDFKTAEGMESAWFASTGHRENMLNPDFHKTGVGIADGMFEGHETKYVVELFTN